MYIPPTYIIKNNKINKSSSNSSYRQWVEFGSMYKHCTSEETITRATTISARSH